MTAAVLSIGSNIGDSLALLRTAAEAFTPFLTAASAVYATPPWGGVRQPDFLNAILLVEDPDAEPRTWLVRAQAVESQAGRTRQVRWGPRTLDVDVITVDDTHSDDVELTLPHPRAHERAFVLVPWAQVDPKATVPGRGAVSDLLAALPAADVAAVRRLEGVGLLP
jgi:2-amino-4-hydroxy-6-hydroxymethyldihydropteridine diphosphokinase